MSTSRSSTPLLAVGQSSQGDGTQPDAAIPRAQSDAKRLEVVTKVDCSCFKVTIPCHIGLWTEVVSFGKLAPGYAGFDMRPWAPYLLPDYHPARSEALEPAHYAAVCIRKIAEALRVRAGWVCQRADANHTRVAVVMDNMSDVSSYEKRLEIYRAAIATAIEALTTLLVKIGHSVSPTPIPTVRNGNSVAHGS